MATALVLLRPVGTLPRGAVIRDKSGAVGIVVTSQCEWSKNARVYYVPRRCWNTKSFLPRTRSWCGEYLVEPIANWREAQRGTP